MQTNCAWIILANNLHQSFAQIALAIKLWEPVATIRYKLEITRETGYHSLYIKIATIPTIIYKLYKPAIILYILRLLVYSHYYI